MLPEDHQRVRKLFDEVLDLPEAERLPFLQQTCSDEAEVLAAVLDLLKAHDRAQVFLEENPQRVQQIGRYLVKGELGRGAMGVVYEAVDPLIGRNIALKAIHSDALANRAESGFMRDRLVREARLAGALSHPGIVTIYDVGQDGEIAFIAMELVDGTSLQEILCSERRFGNAELLGILRQTAAALDYAHRNKVVHCDVKPGNIMLDRRAAVKLTDFGIAKIASTQRNTLTGLIMGTPSYMSPEQIEAQPVDGRSDQFSLAAVAYELLTGATPFAGESLAALAHMIVYGPRPSARAANPELPVAADEVLQRALDKLPEHRYGSCMEFVTALEGALKNVLSAQSAMPAVLPERTAPAQPLTPVFRDEPKGTRSKAFLRYCLSGASILAGLIVLVLLYQFFNYSPQTLALPAVPSPMPAPLVARFTVEPSSIKAGASATLQWEVTGATEVVINPGIGKVASSGTLPVDPLTTTDYALLATGDGGRITQKANLSVDGFSAVDLVRRASNESDAMVELGEMYDSGLGITRDDSKAVSWFRKAADLGNSSGMLYLGGMYLVGAGVAEDYALAAEWLGKAADRGESRAMVELGEMYQNGQGFPTDLKTAEQFYRMAASLGDFEAQRHLDQLHDGGNHFGEGPKTTSTKPSGRIHF